MPNAQTAVRPGTIVNVVGIGVRLYCALNDHGQPYVGINTEDLADRFSYGPENGMPIINVELNDAVLYDDEGRGDRTRRTVYVVRPLDNESDASAFAEEGDAEAYAAALRANGVDVGDIETCRVETPESAVNLIAHERRVGDDPDYETLLADPKLSDEARETLRAQARAAGENV